MTSIYHKELPKNQTHIDVYDVLILFGVDCPATAHAIKKLLMAGQRGSKDRAQDLIEANASIKRALEIEKNKKATG